MKEIYQFNRVNGLKFLYENFPYYFDPDIVKLFFVSSKNELKSLKIGRRFDLLLLKRSSHAGFVSDIKFKDNRFFKNLNELKKGIEEFEDIFDFCVECHNFKKGENYYSDRLAIAQFATDDTSSLNDRISFIPAFTSGVNTRDNFAYLEVEFPFNSSKIFKIILKNSNQISKNGFDDSSVFYVLQKIHSMISDIKSFLIETDIQNCFQLIIRIDSNLNLLPIDLRTADAWIKKKF